jgi:hypothetical protein
MDGFTRYTNFVTHYATTFAAMPELLTAKYCYWDMEQTAWLNEAWRQSTFLPDLKAQGFVVKLYEEKGQVYDDIQQLIDIADNTSVGKILLDEEAAAKKILQLSAYRYVPYALKPTFWMPADDFGRLVYSEDAANDPYVIDDIHVYDRLTNEGLRTTGEAGNFALYHLQGPHEPILYDENLAYSSEATLLSQTKGGFRIVYELIDQLKALGLYESSTIIVMGDHGWPNNPSQLTVEAPMLAGLFVKPAGVSGAPIQESHAPIASENLRATIVQAAGGDAALYGVPVQDVQEGDQTPRKFFWKNGPDHQDLVGDPELHIYEVGGDGRDIANWRLAETIKPIPYWYY